MTEKDKKIIKKEISPKIHKTIASIHLAFMQPRKTEKGEALRKQYWLEAWNDMKNLSPAELEELNEGLETIRETLGKLKVKISNVRVQKLKARAEKYALQNLNEWEEDEFLDSASSLPVFHSKDMKSKGKRWVITQSLEKPKNVSEVCQAIWTVLTNRAIYIVDKGKKDPKPSPSRDIMIEKHRLAVLPYLLDDKTITDPITGKPLMNLYIVTGEVKETLLWLLAERAKGEKIFCKLFIKCLKKEILDKVSSYEWAKRFSPQALQILHEIKDLS